MNFALVEGRKKEAFAGGRGRCPGCDADVIGRCGEFRIHHWSHKVKGECTATEKEETPWHRQWKAKYHIDWQESHAKDPDTGLRYVADVRTKKGMVLEFQNSPIKPEVRRSRERFYKNMLWVVNGARLPSDYTRFYKQLIRNDTHIIKERWHYFWNRKEAFPKLWRDSSVLVFFDFLGDLPSESVGETQRSLWCLFPGIVGGYGLVARVLRKEFHKMTSERSLPFNKSPQDVLLDRQADYEKYSTLWWRS